MRKLALNEWASIGELIGTVAVVVSLVIVAYSLQRNTEVIQGSTENLVFEAHMSLTSNAIVDSQFAAIIDKVRNGSPLNDIENIRWELYRNSMLDIWAMAYLRNQNDMLADREWTAWDDYFVYLFSAGDLKLAAEQWQELQYGFDSGFWTHVGHSLFNE